MDPKIPTTNTHLAVIGAGPGGYAAAFLGADLGMDVTLIDTEPNPGGVCLYRGCIPSKALLHAAKVITEAGEAKEFGVTFPAPKLDVAKMQKWKDDIVKNQVGGLGQLSKARKITYVQGRATFAAPTAVDVELADGGSKRIRFEHAILATGSRPAAIPDLHVKSPRLLDSTSALELETVPKSLLVIGGGYIGLELGSVYATLGSRVSVVEMMPTLLPGADKDLVKVLNQRIEGLFDAIMLGSTVKDMKEQKNGIKVTIETEGKAKDMLFDNVLVAVGRKPNSENLGLENTRVKRNDRGFIRVDETRRTDERSIFAIGDVVGEPMLAHKASHEGRTAVEVIAGHDVIFDPAAIPAVVFTDPEIAWCGLTEAQASAEGRTVEVARFPWAASGRARTLGRSDGLTKLLIDPESERILGVGIVGAGAGDLIAEGVHAIEMGAVAGDVKLTIHPHPTLSETIMEAAEVFFGQATHIYRPRRRR
jgi:dihydrolipoamide dehydrogenase